MLEMGLFWVGVALMAITLIVLFWHAFQQNRMWGIAGILVIPLLAHIFLAWSSLTVRKATYGLIVGVLALLVGVSGGALMHLPFLTQHEVVQTLEETIAPPKAIPLPNEEQAKAVSGQEENYDPLLTGSEFETVDVEQFVPPSIPQQVNKSPATIYQQIMPEMLSKAIDKTIRLNMKSGEMIEGVLTHVEDHAVTVESQVEGGSLGLSYPLNEIDSIAVRLLSSETLETPETIEKTVDEVSEAVSAEGGSAVEALPETEEPLQAVTSTYEEDMQEDISTPATEIVEEPNAMEMLPEEASKIDSVPTPGANLGDEFDAGEADKP